MEVWMIIAAAAAIAAIAVGIAIAVFGMRARQKRRAEQTGRLRQGFGPEYQKAVDAQGRQVAETDLLKRQERATQYQVRGLSQVEVTSYSESWAAIRAQFVDDPGAALNAAGRLVSDIVTARGYPAADFEQGASALSVDHPRAVQDYRAAHEIAMRNQRNPASTDELREAMRQYHVVISELTDGSAGPASAVNAA